MKRETTQFVVCFFLYLLGFTFLLRLDAVDRNIVLPYTESLATLSASLLNLLGIQVSSQGTILSQSAFAVDIRRGCDGLVASIVLASAFLAYPLAWRDRVVGGLIGYALIFGLNLMRILGLFLLGASGYQRAFHFGHTYISQFAVIAVTMIFWIFWIGRERTERD